MNNKTFSIILAVLVIGIGAVFVLGGDDEQQADLSSEDVADVVAIDDRNYRVKGPEGAAVEVVEFGDFGCSFCAIAVQDVEQLLNKYDGQIEFEFKPFSIPSGQNSVIAHRAAEAAGMQGKFFEMHDLLYQQQQVWSRSTEAKDIIDGFAQQLELDMGQYQSDFSDGDTLDIINNVKSQATDIGVTGTPAFFVNGKLVETQGQYFLALDQAVAEALADSDSDESAADSTNESEQD